jgi:hypothetical protein
VCEIWCSYGSNAQTSGNRSPGRLNLAQWCLKFSSPLYGTYFVSPVLTSRTLWWLPDFWKICSVLSYGRANEDRFLLGDINPDDGTNKTLLNATTIPPDYTASHSKRQQSLSTYDSCNDCQNVKWANSLLTSHFKCKKTDGNPQFFVFSLLRRMLETFTDVGIKLKIIVY